MVFLVVFAVPAMAALRAPPMTSVDDIMMMVPTNIGTSHHQAFLAEARIELVIEVTMIEMMLDANFTMAGADYIDCLPGAQMITSNQNTFTHDIWETTGQELTMIMAISAEFLNDTESIFTTADQRPGAAMAYSWTNIYMPAARMDAMNNINRVTVIVLRL